MPRGIRSAIPGSIRSLVAGIRGGSGAENRRQKYASLISARRRFGCIQHDRSLRAGIGHHEQPDSIDPTETASRRCKAQGPGDAEFIDDDDSVDGRQDKNKGHGNAEFVIVDGGSDNHQCEGGGSTDGIKGGRNGDNVKCRRDDNSQYYRPFIGEGSGADDFKCGHRDDDERTASWIYAAASR